LKRREREKKRMLSCSVLQNICLSTHYLTDLTFFFLSLKAMYILSKKKIFKHNHIADFFMSNYKLLYPSLQTCQSETEISNLFERHIKALLDEKKRMINEIIEWENNLIRQIQENVNQQKNRLEQECKNQLEYLQIKRQEFLDTALIYEERRDREEVRQLLEQCHALKYQLGSFEYLEQPILFIQVQKEKQQPADNKKSTINDHLRIEDNTSVPRSTYASSNQIK
jgi:hypothetical protein